MLLAEQLSTRNMSSDLADETNITPSGDATSKRQKLAEIKVKAKDKTKRVLHINSSEEHRERPFHETEVDELNESPAFNPTKFLNRQRVEQAGLHAKVVSAVQSTIEAVLNPKKAIKSAATKKTAGTLAKSRPYLSRKADLDFLEAYDDLERTGGSSNNAVGKGEATEKDGNIDQCEKHIEELERARLGMRVAWMTARHVQRVRVVNIFPPPPFPEESFFEKQDDRGFTAFDWGKWIAYKLLNSSHDFTAQYIDDFDELPFDIDTLRRHVERLIIVSAPVQTFLSDVRHIYRWEDPIRTRKWMALYFFLWYISHLMTFFWGYVFYSVALNYYYPTSVKELREGIERSMDRGATALKIGELMDKHGSDDWLGPLMSELGPFLQVQVADLANLLEAAYNFYHFRSPSATVASLCLFGALFLVTALTDSRFAMKIFWLIVGLNFFFCWPISSLYPKYRLMVSIFKWALWDVPTHVEWCFQYLQERAAHIKEIMMTHDLDDGTWVRTGRHSLNESDGDSVDSFYSATSTPQEEKDIQAESPSEHSSVSAENADPKGGQEEQTVVESPFFLWKWKLEGTTDAPSVSGSFEGLSLRQPLFFDKRDYQSFSDTELEVSAQLEFVKGEVDIDKGIGSVLSDSRSWDYSINLPNRLDIIGVKPYECESVSSVYETKFQPHRLIWSRDYRRYYRQYNLNVLGRGLFGVVYAIQPLFTIDGSSRWARKLFVRKPQEVSETPSYPQNFKNFLKELKIMINLAKTNQTHHRVHLFDACSEWDRSFYLVLQPVADGSNLEDFMRSLSKESLPDHQRDPPYLVPKRLLQQSRLLDRSDVLRKAVGCLVVSLAALHEAKIAHGDLHRKNILIDNGEVQYTDFGLSISEYRHNSDHMTKEELSKMEESIGPAIPGSLDPYQEDTFCLGGILMKILVAVRPSWPYQPYIWLQLWDICQSLRDHCGKKVSLLEAAKRILPLHEKAEKEFEENFLLAHQELFGKDVPFMPDGNGKLMCGHCELWIKAKQTSLLTNM